MAEKKYIEGIGRRKTSTARVRIYKGKTGSTVNEKPLDEYFVKATDLRDVNLPFVVSKLEGKYYFTAKVKGGGTTGQKDAVKLGIARAILKLDETMKPDLRKNGLLTRDPRMVERKKYHRKKARKKPQFSKR